VPVLPVTIAGGHESWPPGRILPRRHRISITYHPPLEPDPALEPRQAASALAQQVRAVIAGTLGEGSTAARV
jgi:1-acyl-sn-glycerol-3-phosphate acyltransferase